MITWKSAKRSYHETAAARLWKVSADLAGLASQRPPRLEAAKMTRGAERPADPGRSAGDAATRPGHGFEYGKFLGGEYEHFSRGRAVAVMRAGVGDVLAVPGQGNRTGLIIDVLGKNGAPPYVVKWLSDGHIAMVTPGQYARIIPASDETLTEQPLPDDQ